MMWKKFIIILLIGGINAGLIAQNDPKAKEILSQVSERFQNLNGFKATFEYSYGNPTDGIIQSNIGQVTVKGEKYRLVLDDQEIYNDGKTVWTHIKSSRYEEVTINNVDDEIEELTPSNIYNLHQKQGYNYQLLGEGVVNEQEVYEVELTSEKPTSQFKSIKLFVDKDLNDLLGWEIEDDMGGTFEYRFKELKTGVDIPDDYFVFNTQEHPNVEIIDLR